MINRVCVRNEISRSRKSTTRFTFISEGNWTTALDGSGGQSCVVSRESDTMAAADRSDNALCGGKRHFPRPTGERVHGSVVRSRFFSRKSRRPISARTCLGNLGYSSGFAGVKLVGVVTNMASEMQRAVSVNALQMIL